MNELYPYILSDSSVLDNNNELPIFKEIAWDFRRDKPLIDKNTKDFIIVEKDEALKVWIYKTIKIARYRFLIFTDDYGTELEELVGKKYTKGYTESEATRFIKEALNINQYITKINKIDANFKGDLLTIYLNVDTIYNEGVELSV